MLRAICCRCSTPYSVQRSEVKLDCGHRVCAICAKSLSPCSSCYSSLDSKRVTRAENPNVASAARFILPPEDESYAPQNEASPEKPKRAFKLLYQGCKQHSEQIANDILRVAERYECIFRYTSAKPKDSSLQAFMISYKNEKDAIIHVPLLYEQGGISIGKKDDEGYLIYDDKYAMAGLDFIPFVRNAASPSADIEQKLDRILAILAAQGP
jgi:hypothetical protein